MGQFEVTLKQVGIKDIASFSELDDDDLDEMKISDEKSRLALMSVAKHLNEKVKSSNCSKQARHLMRLDSIKSTSFTEQSYKVVEFQSDFSKFVFYSYNYTFLIAEI